MSELTQNTSGDGGGDVIREVERLLTNLQPHILQACIDKHHAKFIDNYVDPALALLRQALAAPAAKGGTDPLVAYLERQWAWSKETFGPALRTKGIVQHITKELREIEADPHDLAEWVDVIILAMDGFWRHGGKPSDLLPAMQAKQDRNFARTWPDWRTMGEDQAIEHDRSGEVAPPPPAGAAGGGSGDLDRLEPLCVLKSVKDSIDRYGNAAEGLEVTLPAYVLANWHNCIEASLAALSTPTPDLGAQGEPVAWAYEYEVSDGNWTAALTFSEPPQASWFRNIRPLYEAPAAPRSGSGVTVEGIAEIKDALIQARGALHLDAMTDEAGKHYGTTTVAQEAIEKALALIQAPRPGETDEVLTSEQAASLAKLLEPIARASRAIGGEIGPFRFETGSGYCNLSRQDLKCAERAFKVLSKYAAPSQPHPTAQAGDGGER